MSGPDGTEVLRRVYWANRATQIVSDAPSEARLHPHLWGHVVFGQAMLKAHAIERTEIYSWTANGQPFINAWLKHA